MGKFASDGNEPPGMEKRLLLAFLLSFTVIVLVQLFQGPKPAEQIAEKIVENRADFMHTPQMSDAAYDLEAVERPQTIPDTRRDEGGETNHPWAELDAEIQSAPIKEIHINAGEAFSAVLSTENGQLKSWILNGGRYTERKDSSEPVNLVEKNPDCEVEPMEVRIGDAGKYGRKIGPYLYKGLDEPVFSRDGALEIEMTASPGNGLFLTRRFSVTSGEYLVGQKLILENKASTMQYIDLRVILGRNFRQGKSGYRNIYGAAAYIDGSFQYESFEKIEGSQQLTGDIDFVAINSNYFIGALFTDKSGKAPFRVFEFGEKGEMKDKEKQPGKGTALVDYSVRIQPGDTVELDCPFYFGPKDLKTMKRANPKLAASVDFGWFSFISLPLLKVLQYFYKFTHNYGVSIIILTILIKILFYPLTKSTYHSMKKMQVLKPEMDRIRKLHKEDKQKMNQEVMALYKRNNVNPMGGCLPLLLQIPVFFALYNVLLYSIEIRHAPFILWIQDLSDRDPYYVTPILMGVSMLVQQKMSPTAMDPTQAKIMLFMPIMFTVIFINVQSGLVLYWFVNNLITIAQQKYIMRKTPDEKLVESEPKGKKKKKRKK